MTFVSSHHGNVCIIHNNIQTYRERQSWKRNILGSNMWPRWNANIRRLRFDSVQQSRLIHEEAFHSFITTRSSSSVLGSGWRWGSSPYLQGKKRRWLSASTWQRLAGRLIDWLLHSWKLVSDRTSCSELASWLASFRQQISWLNASVLPDPDQLVSAHPGGFFSWTAGIADPDLRLLYWALVVCVEVWWNYVRQRQELTKNQGGSEE